MTLNTLVNIESTIIENNDDKQNAIDDIVDEVVEEPLIFKKILLCNLTTKNRSNNIIYCNPTEYKEVIKNIRIPAEYISNKQIKPCFDVEKYIKKGFVYEEYLELTKINNSIQKILNISTSTNIYILSREPREVLHEGEVCLKYSYHFIVDGIRINVKTLKKLIIDSGFKNNEPFDLSIYKNNSCLFSIHTDKKIDADNNIIKVPELLPRDAFNIIDGIFDITKYCASYIEESFIDYDENEDLKYCFLTDDNDFVKNINDNITNTLEIVDLNNDLLTDIINRLNIKRLTDYEPWFYVMSSLISYCRKNNISKQDTSKIIHYTSQKAKTYDRIKVDKWFNYNYDRITNKSYGYNYLVNTCLKEDDADFYDKAFKSHYKQVKADFEKYTFKCIKPLCFITINEEQDEINQEAYYIYSRADLLTRFEDKSFYEKDFKNKSFIKKSFIKKWLKDPEIATYNSLTFKPYHLDDIYKNKHFNLFKGLRAEHLPIYKDYDYIKPILNHIYEVMCESNNEIFKWYIQYLANIIQKPNKKTDVLIVLRGLQGCGKNIIIDMLMYGIIGSDYAIATSNPEKVFFGQFNALLTNKIYAVCNEAGNGLRDVIDKMKDIITAPKINIEKKGKDPIEFDNHLNICATTNNYNPIEISVDDRRIVWLECNNKYCGNKDYFDILGAICNNDKGISSFYYYLKEEVLITINDFEKTRPLTKYYKQQQKINIPNPIKFLLDFDFTNHIYKYKGREAVVIKEKDFYASYKNFCEINKYSSYNKDAFENRTINEEQGFNRCVRDGYKSYRIELEVFNSFIKKYKDLEGNVEDITCCLSDNDGVFNGLRDRIIKNANEEVLLNTSNNDS